MDYHKSLILLTDIIDQKISGTFATRGLSFYNYSANNTYWHEVEKRWVRYDDDSVTHTHLPWGWDYTVEGRKTGNYATLKEFSLKHPEYRVQSEIWAYGLNYLVFEDGVAIAQGNLGITLNQVRGFEESHTKMLGAGFGPIVEKKIIRIDKPFSYAQRTTTRQRYEDWLRREVQE